MKRRAIEWLAEHELISAGNAERALAARPDPSLPAPTESADGRMIAEAVARDLRALYRERLERVVLFGSWARGDARPDSDIDLLVVLDEVRSRRRELDRMNEIMWRHSLASDMVVTELPVSADEYRDSDEPLIVRARAEGLPVGLPVA
jgi:predicted nucleotidyltransferase